MHRFWRQWIVLLLLALVVCAGSAAAAEALGGSGGRGIWSTLFDSTFGLVLFFIFLPVLVTTFIAARQRDRCLKTFHRFHATIRTKDGKDIWGTLHVFSKGVVVAYGAPFEKPGRPPKISYLMYEPDMAELFSICRFHDDLAGRDQRRRERQIHRLAYPGLPRRLWRKVRNLVNTLRDAFSKAIGAFLGQIQRAKPGSQALRTGGKQIEGVGTTLLGRIANAYEPMLERNIGRPVVLELTGPEEGRRREYSGQLGEYSASYLMVLDIDAEVDAAAVADGPGAYNEKVTVRRVDDHLEVTNRLGVEVRAVAVEVGGRTTELDTAIPAGGTVHLPVSVSELGPAPDAAAAAPADEGDPSAADAAGGDAQPLPPSPPGPPVVRLVARRRTDIMAPRAHAIIRHGGVGRQ